ncbi:MAG: hypothetical protein COA78_04820 [Blastopirellula sp.]|nr:MAG: hypothetical protein COA78_04820 [Blastopirellula sp.]
MEKIPPESVKCDQCRKKVENGKDVISVARGVFGPCSVIPLEEESHFCCEACVSDFFDTAPRRSTHRESTTLGLGQYCFAFHTPINV